MYVGTVQPFITTPYMFIENKKTLFNLIGYHEEPLTQEMHDLLIHCRTERLIEALLERYSADTVDEAIDKKFICASDDVYRLYKISNLEIETTTVCNNKCDYCPVKFEPYQEKKIMDLELFKHILKQANQADIHNITFNFFNEPTLDPYFSERLKELASYNSLHLTLHTNGSNFSDKIINLLIKYKEKLLMVRINIPSLDPATYEKMTGNQLSQRLFKGIESLHRAGIQVELVLNGTRGEINRNLPLFYKRYSADMISAAPSHDRAGILKNKYNQNINIVGKLSGCDRVLNTINVLINGDVLSCCNDYYKKYVFGNVLQKSLDEIMTGEQAQSFRQKVFGAHSSEDFLCRHCSYMLYICRSKRYEKIN